MQVILMTYRNEIKVEMGEGARASSPDLIYTENIGTCIGITFYRPKTKEGALHHIGGSEKSSVAVLKKVVYEEVRRLQSGIHVHLVSGFCTIDRSSQRTIRISRKRALDILHGYSVIENIKTDFCSVPREYISYLSLDLESGEVTANRKTISEHDAEISDMLADIFG
jgi:hypothetical protein